MEYEKKRVIVDRRKRPTPMISRYTFWGGRRKTIRREEDKKVYLHVDLYSRRLLLIIMVLLLLNYADAYLTLYLINLGIVVEVNPIMNFFLQYGVAHFILAKFFVTLVAIPILTLLKNLLFVRVLIVVIVAGYCSLVSYQLYIFFSYYWSS
jgi:hypothetical protein